MMREALAGQSAKFSLLKVALPAKTPMTIGILLLNPATDLLYKKLRRDWSSIADPANVEVLSRLDEDFEAKIGEMGGDAFLHSLEDSLSNTLLITERREVEVSDFRIALDRLFEEHVQRTEILPFVTHVPLYSLRAAATKFGEDMEVEEQGWVPAPPRLKLNRNMFAARVVGRSMEPLIPDGSLCLFRAGVVGSRGGRLVLAEDRQANAYAVKRYRSDKVATEEGWKHQQIWLESLNPDYPSWPLEEDQERYRIVAEFVRVLD